MKKDINTINWLVANNTVDYLDWRCVDSDGTTPKLVSNIISSMLSNGYGEGNVSVTRNARHHRSRAPKMQRIAIGYSSRHNIRVGNVGLAIVEYSTIWHKKL
ncbi:unnamed protein product, partial [marine sediment metagenome]